jgi:predicted nuclease with TOPRIM domain
MNESHDLDKDAHEIEQEAEKLDEEAHELEKDAEKLEEEAIKLEQKAEKMEIEAHNLEHKADELKEEDKEHEQEYKIIVNGREKTFNGKFISFEQVIIFAFGSISIDPKTIYTITYSKGRMLKSGSR